MSEVGKDPQDQIYCVRCFVFDFLRAFFSRKNTVVLSKRKQVELKWGIKGKEVAKRIKYLQVRLRFFFRVAQCNMTLKIKQIIQIWKEKTQFNNGVHEAIWYGSLSGIKRNFLEVADKQRKQKEL